MKTLYLDCGMGAAGDMLTAALLELFPNPDAMLAELNSMDVPGVIFASQRKASLGIMGTSVRVLVNGEEEADCSGHISLDHGHVSEHEEKAGHDHESGHGHCHEHDHHHHEHGHNHEHDHHHQEDGHETCHAHGRHDQHNIEATCHVHDLAAGHHANHQHSHSGLKHSHHDHEPHGHHEHGHHHHTSLAEMESRIAGLDLETRVKENVKAVFGLIAMAEAKVHGQPMESIHFHEVGGMDALADIAAVCFLMDCLEPGEVVVSPIHVGSGHVHCAHGILPVPAPATAEILKGLPVYGGQIQGELCTPTGAALLRHFASRFGPMPAMTVSNIGYGLGKRDFGQPNCLRAMLGMASQAKTGKAAANDQKARDFADDVFELTCNLDDMTAEDLAFACQILLESGALDVWTTAVMMKKSRPGQILGLLCRPDDRDRMLELIFTHTTTIGIREQRLVRHILQRSEITIQTGLGSVRRKDVSGFGVRRSKYEHDDLEALARANGLSIAELVARIVQAGQEKGSGAVQE